MQFLFSIKSTSARIAFGENVTGVSINTSGIFKYPDHFISSGRRKFVHVIAAHLYVTDEDDNFSKPSLCSLHASFVQDDDYENGYVCMTNEPLYKRKKYEQFNNVKEFKIWFQDYLGNPMSLDSSTTLILELMLEF